MRHRQLMNTMQGRRGGGRRGRGTFRRGGGGGRGGRGGGGRAASGNPSTYKPTVPHKLGKELGLGGGSGGRPRSADDDDDGAAGNNAFGGSNGAHVGQGQEAADRDEEHAGPGKTYAQAPGRNAGVSEGLRVLHGLMVTKPITLSWLVQLGHGKRHAFKKQSLPLSVGNRSTANQRASDSIVLHQSVHWHTRRQPHRRLDGGGRNARAGRRRPVRPQQAQGGAQGGAAGAQAAADAGAAAGRLEQTAGAGPGACKGQACAPCGAHCAIVHSWTSSAASRHLQTLLVRASGSQAVRGQASVMRVTVSPNR